MWIITKDFGEGGTIHSRVGRGNHSFGEKPDMASVETDARWKFRFRMLGGDGDLDFEGLSTSESFAPLDWAKWDEGCTRIDYKPVNGCHSWSQL